MPTNQNILIKISHVFTLFLCTSNERLKFPCHIHTYTCWSSVEHSSFAFRHLVENSACHTNMAIINSILNALEFATQSSLLNSITCIILFFFQMLFFYSIFSNSAKRSFDTLQTISAIQKKMCHYRRNGLIECKFLEIAIDPFDPISNPD